MFECTTGAKTTQACYVQVYCTVSLRLDVVLGSSGNNNRPPGRPAPLARRSKDTPRARNTFTGARTPPPTAPSASLTRLLKHRGQQGDALHGLPKPHVVAEDPALTGLELAVQPSHLVAVVVVVVVVVVAVVEWQ